MNSQDSEVRQQIRERFANVARSPENERVFPVGSENAKQLGYDADEIDGLPAEVTESFSGVGNPLSLGSIATGQAVLDLGCGAGLDSILAARRIGLSGTVVGIDMTTETNNGSMYWLFRRSCHALLERGLLYSRIKAWRASSICDFPSKHPTWVRLARKFTPPF